MSYEIIKYPKGDNLGATPVVDVTGDDSFELISKSLATPVWIVGGGSGGGGDYTLPIANDTTLGGVKGPLKSIEQNVPVGIDSDGNMFVKDLTEYRTSVEQDLIDNAQNDRLDTLETNLTNNYFNVVNTTPVNIIGTPVTVVTIPATNIVAGYNYRIFANVLATRTGGGANTRTELLIEIKQGATIVTSGNVIMWQDEEVFLPIPQLAKRFTFNDTEPITIECTNANAIGTVVFNNSSITIE